MMRKIGFVLGVGILLAGCASQEKQVEQQMQQPINCATAEGDLRVLQSEKTHTLQQIAQGVSALTPAGAALGILTGTERTKLTVGVGEYNRMIDQRIAQIKQKCGVQ